VSKPALRFSGYAALFDVADQARDTIRKGAFARSIRKRGTNLPLLAEHDPNQRIGQIELVAEDRRGLRVIARIDRRRSRAAVALSERALSGLSIGYRPHYARHLTAGRELLDIDLLEVSLVAHPLQPGARVHLIT
jgi:hypothetical protein